MVEKKKEVVSFFRAPSGFINNLVNVFLVFFVLVVLCFYDVFSHDVLVEAKWELAQLSKKHVCFNHLASCKCCSNSTIFFSASSLQSRLALRWSFTKHSIANPTMHYYYSYYFRLTFLLVLSSGGMTFGTKYFDEMLLFVKAITLHFSTTDCILLCNVFAKYLLTKCDCSRSQKFCATIATEILNPIGVTVAAPQKRALIHSNFDLFFNFPS